MSIPKISFHTPKNKLGFELLKISDLYKKRKDILDHNPFRSHRLDFFAIFLVTKGEGCHEIDFHKFPIQKGNSLIISKGQIHAFDPRLGIDGYLVLFTESFILKYLSSDTLSIISRLYNYHIGTPVYEELDFSQKLIHSLKAELANEEVFAKPNILAAILSLYLLQLERIDQTRLWLGLPTKYYPTFQSFKNSVEQRYTETRNAKDYAQSLFISYKHLNEICRIFTLKTAKQFIDEYIILEIKRNLYTTELSIKEIAYQSGFDEPTNLVKFFKKHTGLTPNQFRKNTNE